jgi:3-dehydroquinate synthetase
MGHVIESVLGLSHGASVAQGLFFALEYSRSEGLLKAAAFDRAMSLMGLLGLAPHPVAIPAAAIERALMADKKRSRAGHVTFIFLRAVGRVERRDVTIDSVVREARRQGWAK